MQYKKFCSAILLAVGISVYNPVGTLASALETYNETIFLQRQTLWGTVQSDGNPVAAATVALSKLGKTVITDDEGRFHFTNLPDGRYELTVTSIGYKSYSLQVEVPVQNNQSIVIDLQQDEHQLEDVIVLGFTRVQEVNKQAYNVTALDAKKLHNTTLDIAHTLDRVSGVRVRESGGVGSNINFSVNGFSGNQVKFFMDGVPMENFGSSFQINNIPINLAERIEVYKGVVPVWLGSDALGGAVNIVSNNNMRNYVDISYSYGSFNTHRSAINAAFTAKNGLTLQVNAFQNYSDNNYTVTLGTGDLEDIYPKGEKVKRFHDQYHNETVIVKGGVLDKSWADKLLVGIVLGKNYKEIQTGARMYTIFGGWHTRGNIVMPTLLYQKNNLFKKGLDFNLTANYNFGKEQSIDTLFRRYDWYGNYEDKSGPGGERTRTLYRFGDNAGTVASSLSYRINEQHSLAVNNVLTSFDRQGFDELAPNSSRNFIPQKTLKNVLGLGYKYDLNDRWATSLFGKYLYQNSRTAINAGSGSTWNESDFVDLTNKSNNWGYGLATSYYILPHLQAKLSYEKSNRLPVNNEIFGDNINQDSNFDLKPESSHNVNLGVNYHFAINTDHKFMLGLMGIYRDADDFIYFRLNNNEAKTIADNLAGVLTKGVEVELKYSYSNYLAFDANLTYQDIRNMVKYEPGYTSVSVVYKDRIPNLPYLFGNTNLSLFFDKVFASHDNLSITHNFLYVNSFYLFWPSLGSVHTKRMVPNQFAHDLNVTYALHNGKYNVALECKNLTDALLYDNFSLQKPSRAFYLKLRYFISK